MVIALLPLSTVLLTTPALSHPGAHITPHEAERMPVFLGLSLLTAIALLAIRSRATMKDRK